MKNTSFKQNNFETVKCDSPSHNGMCCNDQASSLRSLPGLKHDSSTSGAAGYGKSAWRSMNKTHDSGTFGSACQVKAMQECSTVCGMCASQPSLYKARYTKIPYYHRVRSLRDLAPRCLRHFSVGFGSSLCRQRAPALCADAH